jgi:uncharacterized protein YwgA
METRDFVTLAYAGFGGEMQGKTKLQKRVYFLGVMLGKEQDLGYTPHYYGPYSPAVADANAELKALGYVDECVARAGLTNGQGFEHALYKYSLTEAGQRLAERKKAEFAEDWKRIQEKANAINAAGDLHYMLLSAAAKFHFVLTQQGGKATFDGIKTMAGRLGWAIGDEELNEARDFLKSVGLITVS